MGRDGVVGLVLVALSGLLFSQTLGLPAPALVPLGPAFYPRFLLALVAALGLALVGFDLAGRRRGAARPAPAGPTDYGAVLITFGVFAAYVLLLPGLGYRLATFLFVAGMQAALKLPRPRDLPGLFAVALVTTAATYYAFEVYLQILLPRGRLVPF
jgi:hypothetical protein